MVSRFKRAQDEMDSLNQQIKDLEDQRDETKTILETLRSGLRAFSDERRKLRHQGVIDFNDKRVAKINKEQDEMSGREHRAENLLLDIMDQIERKKERLAFVEVDLNYTRQTTRGE